jgi:hypothetical protein
MAVDVKKVSDAIELKFKGKSLSKDFKKALATKWAEKIDNDADIDTYINDREDIILETANEGDRRVTAALKKAETTKGKEKDDVIVEEEDEDLKDAPPWAKALVKQNKELAGKVQAFETEKSQQTIAQRFSSDPRLKGIDPKLYKGRVPKTEEEFEERVLEIAEDLKDFVKEEVAGGNNPGGSAFGKDKPNFGGGANKDLNTQPTQAQKAAIEKVKEFTNTLPGKKVEVAVK